MDGGVVLKASDVAWRRTWAHRTSCSVAPTTAAAEAARAARRHLLAAWGMMLLGSYSSLLVQLPHTHRMEPSVLLFLQVQVGPRPFGQHYDSLRSYLAEQGPKLWGNGVHDPQSSKHTIVSRLWGGGTYRHGGGGGVVRVYVGDR